jgi:hypothetical protein
MWSSCRRLAATLVISLCGVASAWAQQTYFVPTIEATAEWNSNRELVTIPELEDETENYRINALALWGWQTHRTQIELRPRIQFQEFPDREGIDPVEYFLDLRAQHHTLKSTTAFFARYAHQDVYNAEYGDAAFDDFDPDRSDFTSSGIVFVGGTRQTFEAEPSFRYAFTELTAVSGLLNYRKVDYGDDFVSDRVGYESPYAELMLIRTLGTVSELSIGPYAARSEADNGSNETDTVGAKASLGYRWSETMYFTADAMYERSDITEFTPAPVEDSVGDWGFEFAGYYRKRLASVRYSIGRTFTPSTFGTRTTTDQVRVQYIRPMSPVMTFNGALRGMRDERVGDTAKRDRDRAIAELSLTRQITPTWYIGAGYRYVWQNLAGPGGEADNNAVSVTVSYRGLNPRARVAQ